MFVLNADVVRCWSSCGSVLGAGEVLVLLGACCRLGKAKGAGNVIIGINHKCNWDDDPNHVHELCKETCEGRNTWKKAYSDLRRGRPRGRAGLR